MNQEKFSILISKNLGAVSAILTHPENLKMVLVLAHGAGAGMKHPFMESLSVELAAVGIGTMRYNFLYMENKKGRPDPPAIAEKTVAEVIGKTNELFPDIPMFAGGKSFGGRMTSQRLAKELPAFIKGIVFFGFPLHPPGKPSVDRAEHLFNIEAPMLFLQGTKDTLAEVNLLTKVCSSLPGTTLQTFEGADHSFKIPKQNLIPKLASSTLLWMENQLN